MFKTFPIELEWLGCKSGLINFQPYIKVLVLSNITYEDWRGHITYRTLTVMHMKWVFLEIC